MSDVTDLYRLYDEAGALLYVGISYSAIRRITSHKAEKAWWDDVRRITVDKYPTRATALEAERAAIIAEKPLHNVAHNRAEIAFRLAPENTWNRGKRTSLLTTHDVPLPRPGNAGHWFCDRSIVVAGVVDGASLIVEVCPMCGGKHTHGWLVSEVFVKSSGRLIGISDRLPHCRPDIRVYQTIRYTLTRRQVMQREHAERSHREFMRRHYPQSMPA